MRPRFTWLLEESVGRSSFTAVFSARSSDWPCLMPPGQCWAAFDQLALLSMITRMFGLGEPAVFATNKSMSSALATCHHTGIQTRDAESQRQRVLCRIFFIVFPLRAGSAGVVG